VTIGPWTEHPVMLTAVGDLVIRAIEEMRPGLEWHAE
jgi:hypothetical protein